MPISSPAASDSDLSPAVSGGGADRDSPAVSGADDGDSDRDSPAVSGAGDSVDGEEAEGQEDDGDDEDPEEVVEEEEEQEDGGEEPVEEVEDDDGGGESAEEAVEEEEEVSVGEDEEGMSVDDEDVGESVEDAIDEEEEKVSEDDAEEAIDEEEEKVCEDNAEEAVDEEEEKVGEDDAEEAIDEEEEKVCEDDAEEAVDEEEEKVGEDDAEEAIVKEEEKVGEDDAEDAVDKEEEKVGEDDAEDAVDEEEEKVCEDNAEEAVDEEEEKVGEDDAEEAISKEEEKVGEDNAEDAVDEEEKKVGEEDAEETVNEDADEMEVDGEDAGAVSEAAVKEDAEEARDGEVLVEEADHGAGHKESAGSGIIDAKDTSEKVEPEELAEDPTSSSCPPDRVNHSMSTIIHVKDEKVGNIAAPNGPNPSDETVSATQLEKEIIREVVKDVEESRDSEMYSKVSENARSNQENDIAARGGDVHDSPVENEVPHLGTNVPDSVVGNEVPELRPKTDLQTSEGLRLPSLHTLEKRPRSSSPDAIIGNANKKPAIICDFFARGWCIKGKSCRFLHQKEGFLDTNLREKDLAGISQNGGDGLPKFHNDHNTHVKHPQSGRTSYPPIGDFRQTSVQSTFVPEYGPYSGGSSITSSLYQNSSNSSAYDRKRDGFSIPNQESHFGIHGFTRLGAEQLDTRTPSEFGIGNYGSRSASLPRNSSPVEVRRNLSPFVGKTSRVQDAWEPSVPFRSSFGHKSGDIPSYSSPYDPLLDSIEPSNLANSSYQTVQKTIINDVSDQHKNGNPILSGIHTPGYSAQEYVKSVPQYHDPVLGKSTVDYVANGAAATVTTRGLSKVDGGNNLTSKEGKHRFPGHAVDGANVNEGETGPGGNLKNMEDKGRNNKESRVLKFFHCALADVVKELVKPSWREGHLSKDAHKMVVKKAVEKILSAIQPHQVPSTPELVNQYLSTSRPKILKLVEGYVHKYSKSSAS